MMFKTRVAAATGPRWVHLLVAIVPVMLADPPVRSSKRR